MKKKNKKQQTNSLSTIQKTIILIIILTTIIVAIAVASMLLFRPERTVKTSIETLASDYYENFIYESVEKNSQSNVNTDEILSKYTDTGFSPISLRDLLLHNFDKTKDILPTIKKYCDEDKTTIKFYPEAPYSKKSYRVNYSYSCEF